MRIDFQPAPLAMLQTLLTRLPARSTPEELSKIVDTAHGARGAGFCTKACPAAIVRSELIVSSPRIGPSRTLSRP
jgi:hypothetical protein